MKKQRIRHYCQPSVIAIPQGVAILLQKNVENIYGANLTFSPAAADTICCHLRDFNRKPVYYDKIITGDLGTVGREILLDLCCGQGFDISAIHADCGIEIYDSEKQGTGAGGSGCGCAAVTLSARFLKLVEEGRMHRILFVPTGALLSTVSFNEGKTVPGIAHAVVIEHAD